MMLENLTHLLISYVARKELARVNIDAFITFCLCVCFNFYFIFISLTTKGKVSTEGDEAYRGVTYKEEHIQTLD